MAVLDVEFQEVKSKKSENFWIGWVSLNEHTNAERESGREKERERGRERI